MVKLTTNTLSAPLKKVLNENYLRFSLYLTCFLVFVVPAITLLGRRFVPQSLLLLALVGIGGISYVMYIWSSDELLLGSAVGVIVLSTFGADFPITRLSEGFPGTIVGDITLVQLPLAALILFILFSGRKLSMRTPPSLIFGCFVLWSGIAAILGGGPNMVVAIYFALAMAFGLLALISFQWLVMAERISFRGLLATAIIPIFGHVTVGVVQFMRQSSFGLTQLGEGADLVVSTSYVPIIGKVAFGTFVSGFTGMSFNLANLVVLGFPILIVLTYRSVDLGWSLLIPSIVSFGIVRASSSDAGRGAFVLAMFSFALLSAWVYRAQIISYIRLENSSNSRTYRSWLISLVIGLLALFHPSSRSGDSSTVSVGDGSGSTSTSGSGGSTSGDSATSKIDSEFVSYIFNKISNASVPLFDLSNLGVRLSQYLAGVAITIKYPIFGLGGMNFVLVAEQYGIAAQPGEALPLPIHNIYITLLAETGLVGFFIYVGTVCLVLLYGFRLLRSSATDSLLVASVMAGMIGSLGFGFWDILQLYHVTGFLPFWVLSGALVGEYCRVTQDLTASSTI